MRRDFRGQPGDGSDGSPRSEAWLFAQAILGNPIPTIVSRHARAKARREELQWLATFSPKHVEELRRLVAAESEARRQHELLQWAAKISTRAEEKLRALQREQAKEREGWRRAEQFVESLLEGAWDPSKHPRAPKGQSDGGRWVAKGGGTASAHSVGTGGAPSPTRGVGGASDATHWYLPAEDKGTWLVQKGDSTFRLKTPVEVNGMHVHEINYTKGVPVLDKFSLPGKTATIVLTGDRNTDIRNAKTAWKKLNPGKNIPENAIFHHDLLHVAEETVEINGKKAKVLVGKMQLVPSEVNRIVFHQGSASVAKHYYKGLGIDVAAIKKLAKEEASFAATGGKHIAKAARKFVPGKITKAVLPFVGRNVVRAIPLIGTGLAIVEFADNVEAHGIGGAVVRATPLLGDLVSAHDLGSDLAKQITDEANAAVDAQTAALNAPVTEAWKTASEQAIAAFRELAPRIQVTNKYGPHGLVDPEEIAAALKIYRGRMQQAN